MKAERTTEVIVTLKMTAEEAAWLNAMMQNPIGYQDHETEGKQDFKMRNAFFEATRID